MLLRKSSRRTLLTELARTFMFIVKLGQWSSTRLIQLSLTVNVLWKANDLVTRASQRPD